MAPPFDIFDEKPVIEIADRLAERLSVPISVTCVRDITLVESYCQIHASVHAQAYHYSVDTAHAACVLNAYRFL